MHPRPWSVLLRLSFGAKWTWLGSLTLVSWVMSDLHYACSALSENEADVFTSQVHESPVRLDVSPTATTKCQFLTISAWEYTHQTKKRCSILSGHFCCTLLQIGGGMKNQSGWNQQNNAVETQFICFFSLCLFCVPALSVWLPFFKKSRLWAKFLNWMWFQDCRLKVRTLHTCWVKRVNARCDTVTFLLEAAEHWCPLTLQIHCSFMSQIHVTLYAFICVCED